MPDSASEALRALRGYEEDDRCCMACGCNNRVHDAFSAVLPELIAVVEAVERLADSTDDEWFYSGGCAKTIRALAALTTKLKESADV